MFERFSEEQENRKVFLEGLDEEQRLTFEALSIKTKRFLIHKLLMIDLDNFLALK